MKRIPSPYPALRLLTILALLACGHAAYGQLGKICGRVTMGKESAALATVRLLDGQGNFIAGTNTDGDGKYEFVLLAPGAYRLRITTFDDRSIDLELINLSIGEFQIMDADFDKAEDQSYLCFCIPKVIPVYYYEHITVNDVNRNAVLDIRADRSPYSLLASMDASAYQRDLGEPLNVRGARSGSTVVLVDGVRLRGELELPLKSINTIDLISSGMPAEYGDATSGVVAITTVSPMAAKLWRPAFQEWEFETTW